MGKELRRQVPRRLLGEWSAQPDRPDPVQLIIEGSVTLDSIGSAALADYAAITGHLLARGMRAPAVHR